MEKFNLVVDIMNNGPMEKMQEWVHEEFLFFKEYGMQDREEWLSENKDVLVFNHIVSEGDKTFRVTAVNFIKEGQTWRLTTHRTLVED